MTPLRADASILCLFANGVDETQFTEIQRAVIKAGYKLTTVAPSTGVVQSWHGASWGHFYPVDKVVGEVLGSDFDALIVPGGQRAMQKLRENLHTRRLINHFLEANKPITVMGEAVGLLALSPKISGREVTAAPADADVLRAQHVTLTTADIVHDDNLLTALGPAPDAWVQASLQLFSTGQVEETHADMIAEAA
ncbi:MAG: peptidase C56 [Alphaproteobacteria bacterium]|nr:peptidase C56 [Alphaproteobacteria bacterium]